MAHSYTYSDLRTIESVISNAAKTKILTLFKHSTANYKSDGSIITDADLAMQAALSTELEKHFPQVGMLSEENTSDEQKAALSSGEEYWCLDPIDGTTNFHATVPLFAVSLALISQSEVVVGIIYDPIREEFFSAIKNQGLWVNQQKVVQNSQPNSLADSIAFVDFKKLQLELREKLILHPPYKSQRNIGTCALEWAWLAAARVQLLLHGSENLWDYAAGTLLLSEAGGVSSTQTGEPVFVESITQRSVVAAISPALYNQWYDSLKLS